MVYDTFHIKLERKKGKRKNPKEKHCTVTGFPQRVSLGKFQPCRATENNRGSPPEARGGARSTESPVFHMQLALQAQILSHHFSPFFVPPTSALFFFLSIIDILKFL